MNKTQIQLRSDEFWPLLNIINEVCHGIRIDNFENVIGAKKQTVVDFLNSIEDEEEEKEVLLNLSDSELIFLKNSFEEVFRQIDEWEFQTRIGISITDARKIQAKLR